MSNFQLDLADGKVVTGQCHFPIKTTGIPRSRHAPLIIAIHGGTYTADYFHIDEDHSAGNIARALNVPLIAIDRPGYKGTSPLEIPNQSTYIREQGKYIHNEVIPAIWKAYSAQLGTSSVVLLGHSIGAAVAIVTASLWEEYRSPYCLSGIVVTGIGTTYQPEPLNAFMAVATLPERPVSFRFPNSIKDFYMLSHSQFHTADVLNHTERLQNNASFEEINDINTLWLGYWKGYAARIRVPVMYTIGEHDALWLASQQFADDFAAAFVNSPRVESSVLLSAPHCIEHSHLALGFLAHAFGFAMECAAHSVISCSRTGLVVDALDSTQ